MQSQNGRSLSLALQRLRIVVHGCCWVAALALTAQVVIWLLAMFTDLRFEQINASAVPQGGAPVVVRSGEELPPRPTTVEEGEIIAGNAKLNPNLVFSRYDRMFARATEVAGGFGAFAMILLLPTIMLGVQLSAGKNVAGAERTVSAFCWTIVAFSLILPAGDVLDLPWDGGALVEYETMMRVVDSRGEQELPATRAGQLGPPATKMEMYARFLALPAACVFGLLLVGFRFSSGVEMAIVHFEEMRLDPELEREAANIKPSSLHGGRSGAALRNVMGKGDNSASGHAPARSPDHAGSARNVNPGSRPSRLI